MRTIYYCPAPTGAGKTYALEGKIAELIEDGQTVILVQPTKLVCQQTTDEILKRFPSLVVELINQDTCDGKVGSYLREYLKRPYDGPHAIIITWAAFIQFPKFDRPERFHLICDEIPQAFDSDSVRVPDSHAWFTQALKAEPKGAMYDLLSVGDASIIRRVSENIRKDEGNKLFQKLSNRLHLGKYLTYVRCDAYQGLLNGSQTDRELITFSMLDPVVFEGFRSVTMVGARAEETILYKCFRSVGVTFVLDKSLMANLRYQEHENGDLINFYYASEQNWSKTAQASDESFRPLFVEAVIKLMRGDLFCWQDNVCNEDASPFRSLNNSLQLPHSPHGLNSFDEINNAEILTALNYTSEESGFLTNFCGIGREEQKVALAYHSAYQTYNRISTRNPNNKSRKIVVLPDRQNAAWQHERFPGSTLNSLCIDSRIPLAIGRPKVHTDSSARKRAHREQQATKQNEAIDRVIDSIHSKELIYELHDCDVSSLKNIGDYVTHLQGSMIAHKFDPQSTALIGSKDEFVEGLRVLSKRSITSKTENMLISPGLFLPFEGVESQRSGKNAVFGKHIFLDIEDGTLKTRDIPKLFPDLELIVYSSFSHTSDFPRFRVVVLTDTVMAPTVYTSIYQQIVQRIECARYANGSINVGDPRRKVHGIDYKSTVSDLFYLPSQPREGKGFFYYHHKGRKPLNVMDWITHAIPTRFDSQDSLRGEEAASVQTIVVDQAEVCEHALQKFWEDTVIKETSHRALFKLNSALIRGGVDDVSRDITLTIAAKSSRSPQDRMRDKRRLMRTVQR